MKNSILLKQYKLVESNVKSDDYQFLAAKLLNTFGVVVDKPEKLTSVHVKLIGQLFGTNIPSSFYSNPQDTKYFTCDELLLEQLVSYFTIECIHGVASENKEDFDRIELFKKVLPNYEEGKEIVLRTFNIISSKQADEVLVEYCSNLSSYSRPWSETEVEEFCWLYENNYCNIEKLNSKDNAVTMFNKYEDVVFAKSLDQKDVVKLSVSMVGEKSTFKYTKEQQAKLSLAIQNCHKAPLTKKQAKYFNTINRKLKQQLAKESNINSPYKKAVRLVKENKIVEAAEVFAKNGSLLERNLVWLLSRADLEQAGKIIDLLKVNNPLVSIQFVNGLLEEKNTRTFKFTKNNKVKKHIETSKEVKWRKSVLSLGMKKFVKEKMLKKVEEYYANLPKIGKVFIDDIFNKISLPLNTSASGSGLDTLPSGSRLSIKGDYIRTFTYWKGVHDIDTSVTFVKDGNVCGDPLYWGNYSSKKYGDSALTSGDDRSSNGAEYIDFRISELKQRGYTHAIYSLNGFGGTLNEGEIFTGYQNKDNLDTKAWSSKNIETKIQVKGDSRAFIAFAIDFDTREIIYLNQMLESVSRVVTTEDFKAVEHYFNKDFVNIFNVAKIATLRGEVVESPEDADIVFSNTYQPIANEQELTQSVIKTSDIAKFVNLLSK